MIFRIRQNADLHTRKAPGYYPATPLPYVANVSWPRSGHHLLVRLLQGTFGPLFGYCEAYVPRRGPDAPCCGRFPCSRTGLIHMSKQHDFDLKAEVPAGVGLVVQYRAFLPSTISQYEMTVRDAGSTDTAAAFRAYAEDMLPRYRGFMARWVAPERAGRILIAYEDLVNDPVTEARKVLDLYGMGELAPQLRRAAKRVKAATYVNGVEKVQAARGISGERDVSTFRHHDAALFADLTARADAPY